MKNFKVSQQEAGMTLLAFLRKHCTDAPSVKALKRAVDHKQCTINGRVETFSTHLMRAGDVVEIELQEKEREIKSQILWEDDALIAYNKPAGVTSDPKNFKGHLVHRLDKETSGVILAAKSKAILEKMIELFRGKEVHKTYLALVDGVVRESKGKIVSKLTAKHRFQGQTVYGSSSKGEYAETLWERVSSGPKASLLKCFPITGRTHQIRVHLQHRGHPILGDNLYGGPQLLLSKLKRDYRLKPGKTERPLIDRVALHAHELRVTHPVTNAEVVITSPLPHDMEVALKMLRRHAT